MNPWRKCHKASKINGFSDFGLITFDYLVINLKKRARKEILARMTTKEVQTLK